MELNFFKDKLFELLNESEDMKIADIETDDTVGSFMVKTTDGDIFEIQCSQIQVAESKNRQPFITKEELEKCRRVAEAYTELYESDDILVLEAGKYGFVKLQYYRVPFGFDELMTFTDSRSMFEDLWEEWLATKLLSLSKGTPMAEMSYEDIFKCLPKEKRKEIMDKKKYFAKKAGLS